MCELVLRNIRSDVKFAGCHGGADHPQHGLKTINMTLFTCRPPGCEYQKAKFTISNVILELDIFF